MDTVDEITPESEVSPQPGQTVKVLVIGNNPIELGKVHDYLAGLRDAQYVVEFAFSGADSLKRAQKFKPSYVLVDDNLSQQEIKNLVVIFQKDKKTASIPFALLKTTNYQSVPFSGFSDFLLKAELSPEMLSKSIKNALRPHRRKAVA